jgi:ABC-type Fe3+/spermidine/putrescine transport system ATPase subunit
MRTEDGLETQLSLNGSGPNSGVISCGIRPERVRVGRELQTDNKFTGTIRTVTFNGSYLLLDIVLTTGRRLTAELRSTADFTLKEGDDIWVGWNRKDMLVFQETDPDG